MSGPRRLAVRVDWSTDSSQATSRCSPREQRAPIHDGDDSWIGSDRNKEAFAVPVDGVRAVVAETELCRKQRLGTLRETDRGVKGSAIKS